MNHRFFNFVLLAALLASLFGYSPVPVHAAGIITSDVGYPYATDHLIVKLRPEVRVDAKGTHVASLDRSLANLKAVEMQPLEGAQQTYRVEVTKGADILQAVETLNQDAAVEYAEPDYLAQFASAPDDARYSEQWGLAKVQAEGAWAETMGTSTVVIAVIDSGVDLTHEDLAANLWVNPGEIAGNGVDDDNNGFVDDVHGWNFIDGNNDPSDYIGHGSLVAGVAAAKTNNTVGIAGVCGNCRIMAVKITQLSGFANYSDIAAGIYYAADKGAKVINLSVGGYANSQTVQNAVNYALNKNIVVVAGAGNDNKSELFYPAAYEGVIAVAGTDSGDVKVNSSNYGAWVDISAPGINILSTTLGDYASDTGTSYATPFVSGAAGLLLSLHPEWTPAMVRSQFLHTTDAIDSLNPGYAGKLGTGRLNLTRAIQAPHPILTYKSYTGNGVANLRPNFGSTVALNVTLYNDWADASEVSGTLSSSDPYVTISTATAEYGTILSGENVSNATAFTFEIASGAGYNHAMPFSLELSANGGAYTATVTFTITTRTSEEVVSGTIESDTTWTSDKTYKVTGNVGVPPDVTLTIQPGTVVQFAGNYSLNVGGTLVAQGTAEQPISFGPYTAGGTWNRIYFDDPSLDAQSSAEGAYLSGNVLENVILTGASGGIACTNATPYLSHVNTNVGGLTCALGDTDLWLTNSEITGSMNVTQGGATPEHFNGVQITGSATLPPSLVTDSLFGGALTINGDATVTNTTATSMTVTGVGSIQHVTTTNGNLSISSGNIVDSTSNNGMISAGTSSTITYSSANKGSISVGASSSIATCTVTGGGIISGTGSVILRNNVQTSTGVGINASGNSTITYNRVVGTQKGIVTGSGVVENNLIANTTGNGLEPGTASVQNNTLIGIQGNGVYLNAVPSAFTRNNFEFNTGTYDVYLTVPKTTTINLIGQGNWWGTTSSSAIGARIYDYYDGDYTLAKLIYAPVATMPIQTAPGYVRSVTLNPASPVGIQTVNFTVEFSRPMDINSTPRVVAMQTMGWADKAPMPTARSSPSVVTASNGKIYAIGGYNNGALNVVEEYDPRSNTWTTKAPMPTARGDLGVAATADGKIYAFGGWNNGTLNTVEVYDTLTNTWISKASMPEANHKLGVVAASNGKIYIVGGDLNNNFIIRTVREYDPHTDTWTTKASLPSEQHSIGVVEANNGKLYAIGGLNGMVHEYDPLIDTWITKGYMLTKRHALGVALTISGKILTVGGVGDLGMGWTLLDSVEEYDPVTNSWTSKTPLPSVRGRLGASTDANGKIYAIGGEQGDPVNIVQVYTPENIGLAEININPQWLDSSHFRASYNFTTQNPRGNYFVTVEDIADGDGMLAPLHNQTTFDVDYAGEISDTTPPSTPSVKAWGNGSLTQLSGQASTNDPDSAIIGYRYAIGITPGGSEVISWTNIATNTVTRTGLSLQENQAYYVSFMAQNLGGLWSPVGISNAVINGDFTNPLPALTNLTPTSTIAGGAGFTLTVNGTDFIDGSVVRWNGVATDTTYLGPTQLSASISAADIASAGVYTVTVYTPAPGGGESNVLNFTVIAPNALPVLDSLSPNSAVAGDPGFTLTVNGTGFIDGSVVRWNGVATDTTYLGPTQLSASISAADIASAGVYTVTVYTPAPGGGESNVLNFTVIAPNPLPVLGNLSSNSAVAGDPGFTLTVNGTDFIDGSVVRWNGAARTTTFIKSTQLSATINAADIAMPGVFTVTVYTPAPGGGVSNELDFTVIAPNPEPVLYNLTPTSTVAGGVDFTLLLTGKDFVDGSEVRWNGTARTTTFINSTQLSATISAADIATPGVYTVTVYTPAPGGGVSNELDFTVIAPNPEPVLYNLTPTSTVAGGVDFTLLLTGKDFVDGSEVRWEGAARTTTFINSTQLSATISAADIAVPGVYTVTVYTPAPGGGVSNELDFTVIAPNPEPVLYNLTPTSTVAGGVDFTLLLTGKDFVDGSEVRWEGAGRTTTYINSTQLSATINALDIATPGVYTVTVYTPAPGGGVSNELDFTVIAPNPVPVIYYLAPELILSGSPEFTLIVIGKDFVTGAQIRWGNTPLITIFNNSTSLQANIPSEYLRTPGEIMITVMNPAPGGGTSNGTAFKIEAHQVFLPLLMK